jgi:hypothetical protein
MRFRRPIWFLILKLREPAMLGRPLLPARRVTVTLNTKDLKPEDVPEVLRRLRPDLLDIYSGITGGWMDWGG